MAAQLRMACRIQHEDNMSANVFICRSAASSVWYAAEASADLLAGHPRWILHIGTWASSAKAPSAAMDAARCFASSVDLRTMRLYIDPQLCAVGFWGPRGGR